MQGKNISIVEINAINMLIQLLVLDFKNDVSHNLNKAPTIIHMIINPEKPENR